MEMSLFHRLSGAWLAYRSVTTQYPTLAETTAIAPKLWQRFCHGDHEEDILKVEMTGSDCPLETALSLLPILLFYHEDSDYLGDRLNHLSLSLPTDQLPIITTLGEWLGAALQGIVKPDQFVTGFEGRSPDILAETAFVHDFYRQHLTWQDVQQALINPPSDIGLASPEYGQLYGAFLWSHGNIQCCMQLLETCSPIVQAWGLILLGSLRGDRQLTFPALDMAAIKKTQQEILLFWSRWSGLPPENQLQLEQFSIIAPAISLKYRPSLNLISQRHLPRPSP